MTSGKLIPPTYSRDTEASIATFNFTDIATGTGYSTFYGLRGDADEYATVISTDIYSERMHTSEAQTLDTTFTEHLNIDFDIIFNLPRNMRGIVIGNIPIGIQNIAASRTYAYYIEMKVYHVTSGGTETLLGTGTSDEFFDVVAGATIDSEIALCFYDQTAVQHFKKGEKLRFSIGAFYKVTSGTNSSWVGIGHDPQNRTDGAVFDTAPGTSELQVIEDNHPTRMSFHVPFVIDL